MLGFSEVEDGASSQFSLGNRKISGILETSSKIPGVTQITDQSASIYCPGLPGELDSVSLLTACVGGLHGFVCVAPNYGEVVAKKLVALTPGVEILKLQDAEDDRFTLEDEVDNGHVQMIALNNTPQ